MKEFLNDYIVTLSGKRQENIHALLDAAKVGKEDLDSIAAKLADIQTLSPIVITGEAFGGRITADKFDGALRDAYRRTLELFQGSNLISLLLDSHASVLSSEIKALEDELLAMEKAVSNYAFTLSDNGAYDYAFTETFNDETMRNEDVEVSAVDRSGINFEPSEAAVVNSASGVLTLSPSLSLSYGLSGDSIDNNCLGLATSDTGLLNALNTSVANGWRVAIAAPRPISSKLVGASKQGAQIKLEFLLGVPAPCDSIILVPFSDIPVEILAVDIFSGVDNTDSISILPDSINLDRPFTINFPLQSVAKFHLLVNQSIYTRGTVSPAKEEVTYRDFYGSIRQERMNAAIFMGKNYEKNRKALKKIFLSAQPKDTEYRIFKSVIPVIDFEANHGPLTIDRIVNGPGSYGGRGDSWDYKSKINSFMRRMIDEKVFASNANILNDRQIYNGVAFGSSIGLNATMLSSTQEYPRSVQVESPLSADILSYTTIEEDKYLDYQYNIGLRNISIGTGVRVYRGVFVSKQIPAPSDSGEVRIKVDDTNYVTQGTSRDSGVITSIEYSITNKSTPKSESDWLPILPIDQSSVVGERLFIDEAGTITFRFPVALDNSLAIYKNGYALSTESVRQFRNEQNTAINNVQIATGTFLSTDIFTADYTPYGDQSTINFVDKGFGQSLLASAYDGSGAGETFSGTYNNQVITLINEPYVNYDLVNSTGAYSTTYGFIGTYQPITIIMADGSVAMNQTNYVGISQNNLSDFDETKTAYIHSGKNIVFNKPVTSTFTVYYQYLPSNLRFRTVMRVNDINYISPIVSSVQLKTKTLKANARKAV